MRRKRLTFFLVAAVTFIMLFSNATVSFATTSTESSDGNFQEELLENTLLPDEVVVEDSSDTEITPFNAGEITITSSFKKSSGKGIATIKAFKPSATKMTSTIRLQELSARTGEFINSSAKPATASKAGSTIVHTATFSLSASKTYRIKTTVIAYDGNESSSKTTYCKLK